MAMGTRRGARLGARLRDLWAGRLPLVDAFWTYQVFWGVCLNIGATLAALAVIVAGKATAAPDMAASTAAVAAAFLHLAVVPYNTMTLVGVWRSAARPQVPRLLAAAARGIAAAMFLVFLVV
jgi:hypothetical protein